MIYVSLDVYEMFNGNDLIHIFDFIRAASMCYVIFYLSKVVFDKFKEVKICMYAKEILTDCSKYSLQIYLFNGYLLTTIRIILCNLLNIRDPFMIVMAIWIGDLVITLILCKCILKKIPIFARLCGIG